MYYIAGMTMNLAIVARSLDVWRNLLVLFGQVILKRLNLKLIKCRTKLGDPSFFWLKIVAHSLFLMLGEKTSSFTVIREV